MYKGTPIRLSANFSAETLWSRREWHKLFKESSRAVQTIFRSLKYLFQEKEIVSARTLTVTNDRNPI